MSFEVLNDPKSAYLKFFLIRRNLKFSCKMDKKEMERRNINETSFLFIIPFLLERVFTDLEYKSFFTLSPLLVIYRLLFCIYMFWSHGKKYITIFKFVLCFQCKWEQVNFECILHQIHSKVFMKERHASSIGKIYILYYSSLQNILENDFCYLYQSFQEY